MAPRVQGGPLFLLRLIFIILLANIYNLALDNQKYFLVKPCSLTYSFYFYPVLGSLLFQSSILRNANEIAQSYTFFFSE